MIVGREVVIILDAYIWKDMHTAQCTPVAGNSITP